MMSESSEAYRFESCNPRPDSQPSGSDISGTFCSGLSPRPTEITHLLNAWAAGSPQALSDLLPLVYDQLKRRARHYLRDEKQGFTLQTGDLVHEAYFRLSSSPGPWHGRNHFFAMAARKMRHLLVDRARAKNALKRGGGMESTVVGDHLVADQPSTEMISLHEGLEDLAQLDSRKAEILELRYFGGLENREIAGHLGVSESTVEREQRFARAWLESYLKAPSHSANSPSQG